MRLRILLLPALLIAAGCSDGLAPGALSGRWGGVGAQVDTDARRVNLLLDCSAARFDRPIVPDAAGDFTLGQGAMTPTRAAVVATGHIAGDQMTLTLTFSSGDSRTLSLQRGDTGVFTALCVAA